MNQQRFYGTHPVSSYFLCGFFVFLMIAGCDGERPQQGSGIGENDIEEMKPVPGGMVVIALTGDPDGLNPLIRRSAEGGQVIAEIQDTLTEMEGNLELAPRIARSWELAPDGLSIVYHLRPWVWEDGHPLTAHDVAASFRLFKNPDVASHRRGFFRKVESVEVIDDSTLRYRFAEPLPAPLSRTQHAILPLHIVADLNPSDVNSWSLNQKPLASGPFRMESWDHSREIVLARNEKYPLTKALLDRVSFRIMREPATRIIALERGEVDFVGNVSPHDAKRLEENEDLKVLVTQSRRFYHLLWNCRNPRFRDTSTRKALSLAIDRQRMNQTLMDGFSDLAVGPVPQVVWNFNHDLKADPFDPTAASSMLADAGWKDENGDGILERGGVDLEFEILTRQGDPVRTNGVVIIRENFAAIGAKVNVRAMELMAGMALVKAGEFDSYLGALSPNLFGDPSSSVHSSAVDEYNNGFYSNTVVDSLLDAALSQQDRNLAKPIWDQVQKLLQEDPPAAYLLCPQRLDVISRRIQNVRPDVQSPFNNLTEWWIAPNDRKYHMGGDGP